MVNTNGALGPLDPDARLPRRQYCKNVSYSPLRTVPAQQTNDDERRYKNLNYYANFSKGLPHNSNGEVEPSAYQALVAALDSGPSQFAMKPPPAFRSSNQISEVAENYWMALCRDINFIEYESDPLIAATAADLSLYSCFEGPKQAGEVTPRSVFRGFAGDVVGPYLSQFLIQPIPYGSQLVPTTLAYAQPAADFMTTEADWLAVQNGAAPSSSGPRLSSARILTTGRDLANYVYTGGLFQTYLNACLLLITPKSRGGFAVPGDPANPYLESRMEIGAGTLGLGNFRSLISEVASRALNAAWYQSWFVHRRLRPEEFGGRLHFHLARGRFYEFSSSALDTLASGPLSRVHAKTGTWFLPMAYPEGCPVHPAYGAGHASVAGACVTVLKALFQEEKKLAELGITPVMPNAGGTASVSYTGADRDEMTIGGELNKLASNISIAANFAGTHWRSDYSESVRLGEEVALHFLHNQVAGYNKAMSCSITRFDGTKVNIGNSC